MSGFPFFKENPYNNIVMDMLTVILNDIFCECYLVFKAKGIYIEMNVDTYQLDKEKNILTLTVKDIIEPETFQTCFGVKRVKPTLLLIKSKGIFYKLNLKYTKYLGGNKFEIDFNKDKNVKLFKDSVRGENRHYISLCDIYVNMVLFDKSYKCKVDNISQNGIKLKTKANPNLKVKQLVVLGYDSNLVTATIKWLSKEDEYKNFGLEFSDRNNVLYQNIMSDIQAKDVNSIIGA